MFSSAQNTTTYIGAYKVVLGKNDNPHKIARRLRGSALSKNIKVIDEMRTRKVLLHSLVSHMIHLNQLLSQLVNQNMLK